MPKTKPITSKKVILITLLVIAIVSVLAIGFSIFSHTGYYPPNKEKVNEFKATAARVSPLIENLGAKKLCEESWFGSEARYDVNYFVYYTQPSGGEDARRAFVDSLYSQLQQQGTYSDLTQGGGFVEGGPYQEIYFSAPRASKTVQYVGIDSKFESQYAPSGCGQNTGGGSSNLIRLQISEHDLK